MYWLKAQHLQYNQTIVLKVASVRVTYDMNVIGFEAAQPTVTSAGTLSELVD